MSVMPSHAAHARYVLLNRFESLTGYTVRAAQGKIAKGEWIEGKHYRKAPDGHILIDMMEYSQWVERGRV